MSFIDKLREFFDNLFHGIAHEYKEIMNKVRPFMHQEIPLAITFVNVIKDMVENPLLSFATAAIPGNFDDKLVEQGKVFLPKLAAELKLFQIAAEVGTNEAIINAMVEYIRSIDPQKRFGKYEELANYLTQAFTDGKLTWSEIVIGVKIAYDKNVNIVVAEA